MKAVLSSEVGGPEMLAVEEAEASVPGPGEVLTVLDEDCFGPPVCLNPPRPGRNA